MNEKIGGNVVRAVILGSVALTLAGCGGSSSDPTVPPVQPPTRASFAELKALGQTLFDEQDPIDFTPEASMPVSGTATYSGAASFKSEETAPSGDLEYPDYELPFVNDPEMMSEVKERLINAFGCAELTV